MAKISGTLGTAALAGGATTYITGWTLDITGEVIDVTDSSVATWNAFIGSGFKSWSGTFEGFQETNTADLSIGAAPAELTLELDASRNYGGTAIITGCSTVVDVPGAEAVKKSYTFQGTSDVALTNA